LNNVASNVGGTIKLFFDYSLLNEDQNFPSFFSKDESQIQTISTNSPSYYMISVYDLVVNSDDSLSKEFLELTLENKMVHYYIFIFNLDKTLVYSFNTSEGSSSEYILKHKSGDALNKIIKIEVLDHQNKITDFIIEE